MYGSGIPSDIWKATMDGALKGTDNETFPKPTEIGGYAGVPQRRRRSLRRRPVETVIQPTLEIAPGVTIPFGPPTTVQLPPPGATRSCRCPIPATPTATAASAAVTDEDVTPDSVDGPTRRLRWRAICAAPTTVTCPAEPTSSAPPCRTSSADPSAGTR